MRTRLIRWFCILLFASLASLGCGKKSALDGLSASAHLNVPYKARPKPTPRIGSELPPPRTLGPSELGKFGAFVGSSQGVKVLRCIQLPLHSPQVLSEADLATAKVRLEIFFPWSRHNVAVKKVGVVYGEEGKQALFSVAGKQIYYTSRVADKIVHKSITDDSVRTQVLALAELTTQQLMLWNQAAIQDFKEPESNKSMHDNLKQLLLSFKNKPDWLQPYLYEVGKTQGKTEARPQLPVA